MSENPGTSISPEELEELLAKAGMTEEDFDSEVVQNNPERKIFKSEQKKNDGEEATEEENHASMTQEEINALFNDEDKP